MGKRIAIIATEGFEQSELLKPKEALEAQGFSTVLISDSPGEIRSWAEDNWGQPIAVDMLTADASATDFDGLLVPGGTINCDSIREDRNAVRLVQEFVEQGKPIAAICHGPQLLIEAGVVNGRTLTSYNSIRTDLQNAGANWKDQEVVVDKQLITSRTPKDLPAFIDTMINQYNS